ncbi:hypothetical protein [Spirosoma rigui]|uniref:hypothetical protein n=1 Tax=Spirosoma rigui TaxID=564064 RepID=UPI0009AFA609|nr:hypothetical protein [Spirosoma rigui]
MEDHKERIEISGLKFQEMVGNGHYFHPYRPTYVITTEVNFADIEYKLENFYYKSEILDIDIASCFFEKPVYIKNIKQRNLSLNFKNCNINSDLLVINSDIDNLKIEQSDILDFRILGSNILTVLLTFSKIVSIHIKSDKDNYIEHIVFLSLVVRSGLSLRGDKYGKIKMDDLVCDKYDIRPISFDKLLTLNEVILSDGIHDKSDEKVSIGSLIIIFHKSSASIELLNINVTDFVITGLLKSASFFLENSIIKNLKFINFVNDGRVRFHNISILENGICSFIDSHFGKTEFNGFELGLVEKIVVYSSNLTEIITTNTSFPQKVTGKNLDDEKEVREVYRQLKYAASKQGDRIRELEYEKYEMNSYEKTLKGWIDLKDIIILWSNRVTNNHGQNYAITLFYWFIPLTTIFYMLIKVNLGYSFSFGIPNANDISQYIESSLNPLHDFNKVFDNKLNENTGKARLYDSILKIISGYLIFQFLRAFRKYVK